MHGNLHEHWKLINPAAKQEKFLLTFGGHSTMSFSGHKLTGLIDLCTPENAWYLMNLQLFWKRDRPCSAQSLPALARFCSSLHQNNVLDRKCGVPAGLERSGKHLWPNLHVTGSLFFALTLSIQLASWHQFGLHSRSFKLRIRHASYPWRSRYFLLDQTFRIWLNFTCSSSLNEVNLILRRSKTGEMAHCRIHCLMSLTQKTPTCLQSQANSKRTWQSCVSIGDQ